MLPNWKHKRHNGHGYKYRGGPVQQQGQIVGRAVHAQCSVDTLCSDGLVGEEELVDGIQRHQGCSQEKGIHDGPGQAFGV